MLPEDGHVHSQFSWDAPAGDMHATCARAVAIGLPSLVFTEHVDPTPWAVHGRNLPAHVSDHLDEHGRFLADPLDITAYLEEVDRCRHAFPPLRILTGIELSEPHLHPSAVIDLLGRAGINTTTTSSIGSPAGLGVVDRVLGSVHSVPDALDTSAEEVHIEAGQAFTQRSAVDAVTAYLREVSALAASDAAFDVLGHIDYPLRRWPSEAGPVPWTTLQDAFWEALEALAASGRALEVNTRLPFSPRLLTWWHQAGGRAVAFGSDAHRPDDLARDFTETAALVQAHGYRQGSTPHDYWQRT